MFRWYYFPIGWFFSWFLSRSFSGVLSSTNTHQLGICMTQLEGLIFFPYFFFVKRHPSTIEAKKRPNKKWSCKMVGKQNSSWAFSLLCFFCLHYLPQKMHSATSLLSTPFVHCGLLAGPGSVRQISKMVKTCLISTWVIWKMRNLGISERNRDIDIFLIPAKVVVALVA